MRHEVIGALLAVVVVLGSATGTGVALGSATGTGVALGSATGTGVALGSATGTDASPGNANDGTATGMTDPARATQPATRETDQPATKTGGDSAEARVIYTYRLPEDPDEGVEVTASIPDTSGLSSATVYLTDEMTAEATDGFDCSVEECEVRPSGESVSVTYTLATADLDTSTRREEWAVVSTGWGDAGVIAKSASDDRVYASLTSRHRVDGEGRVVHGEAVVLGEHSVAARSTAGQRLRIVTPGNLTSRYPTPFLLGLLHNASRTIGAGEDDAVTAILSPSLGALTAGSTIGDRTFLVRPDVPPAVWFHEYVHTQQEYTYQADMSWFKEASAEYYGYQVAVRHGYADAGAFDHMLLQTHDDESVLSDPDTWDVQSDYHKGAAVLALLDRRIRNATGGEHTLRDVFERVNARERVNVSEFLAAVRDVAGAEVAATARRYVTTDAVPPDGWSPGAYERAYGYEPADVRVDVTAVAGSGPGWNRTLALDGQDVTAVPGETVAFTSRAVNRGGMNGFVSLDPRLSRADEVGDFETLAASNAWLRPDETVRFTTRYRFDEPGVFHLTGVGDPGLVIVHVERPNGTLAVTDLAVDGDAVAGETAAVTATVRNDDGNPANGTVPVRVDGDPVAERSVLLNPGESRPVSVQVTFDAAGEHTVAVGDAETTVTVDPGPTATPTDAPTATPTAGTTAPGDGSTPTPTRAAETAARSAGSDTAPASPDDPGPATSAGGPAFGVGHALLALLFGCVMAGRRLRR